MENEQREWLVMKANFGFLFLFTEVDFLKQKGFTFS